MKALLMVALLVIAGCSNEAACPPGGGCFCRDQEADGTVCHTLGPQWIPYCCTDNGGKIVDCGQPANCVPKPGLDGGSMGANYCCPQ